VPRRSSIPYAEDIRPEDTQHALSTVVPSLFPNEDAVWAVNFAGTCPRCADDLLPIRKWVVTISGAGRIDDRTMEALVAAAPEGLGRATGDETFDLRCSCTQPHAGRTAQQWGCGSRFRVRVTWP
jgi:hypothetical protein